MTTKQQITIDGNVYYVEDLPQPIIEALHLLDELEVDHEALAQSVTKIKRDMTKNRLAVKAISGEIIEAVRTSNVEPAVKAE